MIESRILKQHALAGFTCLVILAIAAAGALRWSRIQSEKDAIRVDAVSPAGTVHVAVPSFAAAIVEVNVVAAASAGEQPGRDDMGEQDAPSHVDVAVRSSIRPRQPSAGDERALSEWPHPRRVEDMR